MSEHRERRCWRPEEELRIMEPEGKRPRIVGLAVPYEKLSKRLGRHREIVRRGAFSESLAAGGDLRADVEHDEGKLLGRSKANTLKMWEDERGVWAEIVVPNTTVGNDALEDVRSRLRDAMSVTWKRAGLEDGFCNTPDGVVREIRKARLTGVTLTAFPAYPQTAGELVERSLAAWQKEQEEAEQEEDPPEATPTAVRRRLLDLDEKALD